MTLEIAEKRGVNPRKVMQYIRDDSTVLENVSDTWQNLVRILNISNLSVLDVDLTALLAGSEIARDNNLLITDSMHVASMQLYGIKTIATTDDKMKKVKDIDVWDPSRNTPHT